MIRRTRPLFGRAKTDHTEYCFAGGFPTVETVRRAYDDADLNRAIQAYRFFYPTVSGYAMYTGLQNVGLVPNQLFGVLEVRPKHVALTPHSDAPLGAILLDLCAGPMVIELPSGPLTGLAVDVHQRWVADMGLFGPDRGSGSEHVILPPSFPAIEPSGKFVWRSSSHRVIVSIRALPLGGDVAGAMERIRCVRIRPLTMTAEWTPPSWRDLTDRTIDATPARWEGKLAFWEALHAVLETEPPVPGYLNNLGELATLGNARGRPFAPDERMRNILEEAARTADAQLRVQSLSDRRPERLLWADRRWEWIGLRSENGDFATPSYTDIDARETWYYQSTGASPSMFRRSPGVGTLCWLSVRDESGAFLDGRKTYKLTVPQPVPARLFWSVTVYDALTRSEIDTDLGHAALRSLFELREEYDPHLELYFGPKAPAGGERRWIKTIPGRGWFAYFRLWGPEHAGVDHSWRPGDFVPIRHEDVAYAGF